MRKIRVQAHPAPVAAAVEACDLVPDLAAALSLDAHVAFAAKFDGCVTHRDADLLLPPGAQPPQLGCCEGGGRDARLRGGADGEGRRECGLGAGESHGIERGARSTCMFPEASQCLLWRHWVLVGLAIHRNYPI